MWTVGAIRSCVSSGDALVEAGVSLLLFLDLGLLRAFGQELESEGPSISTSKRYASKR